MTNIKPCKWGHADGRTRDGKCRGCRRESRKRFRQSEAGRAKERERAKRRRKAAGPSGSLPNPLYLTRRRQWWRAQGIPEPTRPEPATCECCGKPQTARLRGLSADHCHESKRFRGWLCNNCNGGIGMLGDSIEGVQRALDYLRRAASEADSVA